MNILLVEDDLDLGNGVRIALADQGMNVVWVRRLQEARRTLSSEACDLVVLDLGLPDGDGLELVAGIRQQRRDLPLLILTARDSLDDRVRGLDKGADDYLAKPFALAELLSRIRALARRAMGFDDNIISIRALQVYSCLTGLSVCHACHRRRATHRCIPQRVPALEPARATRRPRTDAAGSRESDFTNPLLQPQQLAGGPHLESPAQDRPRLHPNGPRRRLRRRQGRAAKRQ